MQNANTSLKGWMSARKILLRDLSIWLDCSSPYASDIARGKGAGPVKTIPAMYAAIEENAPEKYRQYLKDFILRTSDTYTMTIKGWPLEKKKRLLDMIGDFY